MIDLQFIHSLCWSHVASLIKRKEWAPLFTYLEQRRSLTPFIGEIETTNACNCRCIMCPRGRGRMTRPIGHMARELFEELISQMNSHSGTYLRQMRVFPCSEKRVWQLFETCAIRLHHFGDPLLDPLLVDRVRHVKDKTPFLVHFSTSGQDLHAALSRRLLQAELDRIIIALDATDLQTYKAIRGPSGDYERVLSNVENLLRLKQELESSVLIEMQFISLEANRKQTVQFRRTWRRKPVNIIIKDFATYPDVPIQLAPRRREQLSKPGLRSLCKRPFHSMTVLFDGRVVPCSFDYNGNNVVGDIRQNTIEDIWKGEQYRSFRERFVHGELDSNSLCFRCCQYLHKGQVAE